MTRYLSADYIFPIYQAPIKNGVVAINEKNEIISVYPENDKEIENKEIERYKGFLTPGFINAHCHLELSHLVQKIPQNTKLVPFLEAVMQQPPTDRTEIEEAMRKADEQMYAAGIVAVGDISNTIHSKEVKLNSKIHYHTFIELLGFEPERAQTVFDNGKALAEAFSPLPTSITPHSPYSVNKELFKKIKYYCSDNKNLISIHNQESKEENYLYQYKEGAFIDFYKKMGRNIDFFTAKSRNSIQSIIPYLSKKEPILFVHNTYTTFKDINAVEQGDINATWCFCPNANLYIEGTLPKVETFISYDQKNVLGTDSLASNHHLCILSELKTLLNYFPVLSLDTMLKWACLNGAEFLGIQENFGSLEKGKKPGINLITNVEGMNITAQSTITKLA